MVDMEGASPAHSVWEFRRHGYLPLDRPPRSAELKIPRLVSGLWSCPAGLCDTLPRSKPTQWTPVTIHTPIPLRGQRRISTGFPILRADCSDRHLKQRDKTIGIATSAVYLRRCDGVVETKCKAAKIPHRWVDQIAAISVMYGDGVRTKWRSKNKPINKEAIMKRSAQAIWQGTLTEGVGSLSSLSGALSGLPYSFKGRFQDESGKSGTNPEELIASAHAGCFAMQLSHFLAENGTPATKLDATAIVTVDPDPAGGFTIKSSAITLIGAVPGIDEAKFKELADKAKATCPVSRALGAIDVSLTASLG